MTDKIEQLEARIEELEAEVNHLTELLSHRETMVAELEKKQAGWQVENSYIEMLTAAESVGSARVSLFQMESQEGFLGGRVLPPSPKCPHVQLQTFWLDNDPPATWLTAAIRSGQLPAGMSHRLVPPQIAKAILTNRIGRD